MIASSTWTSLQRLARTFDGIGDEIGGVAVNAVAYATQPASVNAGLCVVLLFVGLVGVSTSLGQTRLVLTSLLDEPSIAPLGDPATA